MNLHRVLPGVGALLVLGGCFLSRLPGTAARREAAQAAAAPTMENVIPRPASVTPAAAGAAPFLLTPTTALRVAPASAELRALGEHLAAALRPATGFALPVTEADAPGPGILLTTVGGDPTLGPEGYTLEVTAEALTLRAAAPAGLFRGLQTVRQLLPARIEARPGPQPGPWPIVAGIIRDQPRFAYRGAMLDIARHFFGPDALRRLIDHLATLKLNHLHLHLSDDQGWRIVIAGWPRLTSHGGFTAVGGGTGGFLSAEDYQAVVDYAAARYITVVPEIDLPGHTQAALASYPELTCDGKTTQLYTGIEVGFSSLCIGTPTTDRFVREVLSTLAAMTPGPYLHIGGDEAKSTKPEDYLRFIASLQEVVRGTGKRLIGWEDIAASDKLDPTAIAQHWHSAELAGKAKARGMKIIMSPASRSYLDMKYDPATALGLNWAGYVDEEHAYAWDPVSLLPGLTEADVLGVEAPLWTETVTTMEHIETLAFPRLAGHAELGWSPAAGRSWPEYRKRLAALGPRWTGMGIQFHRSDRVDWPQ